MDSTTTEALCEALENNFLFSNLDYVELLALAEETWVETIPAGSRIVREGDDADALYVVLEGGVNVQKNDGQFLSYLGRGGFFGEMALFATGLKRTADCVSAMDTTCAIIRKEVLHRFCDEHPKAGVKIYRAIIETLAERLQATSADLAMLMSTQVKQQSDVSALVEKAKKRRG